jgi:hypothetical protein
MALQEKFEILLPAAPNEDDGNAWASFESARNTKRSGQLHRNNTTSAEETDMKFNYTPTTTQARQERLDDTPFPRTMAGTTDVSADANPEAFAQGFKRHPMAGCSDEYSGEHVDLFYGEAIGDDGNEGFVERNNYLDRI